MKARFLLLAPALALVFATALAAAPSTTLNQPNGNQVIGSVYSVDFNASDADNADLSAALYYSSTAGDFNNFIADLNLNDYSNYTGLSCGSTVFLTTTNCTYDWNLYRPGVSTKDANLVLYMPLDTYSFRDFSPLANNGSATTFDKTSSSGVVAGKINRAMKFDGVDDYISVTDTDRLDLQANDFTIELWAARSATDAIHVLVDKRPDASNGYVLQFNDSNQVEAQICNGTCTTITSASTVTDTGWHYIAIEFDRSANAQLYIDGSADGSATSISSKSAGINTAANLRIGARSYDSLANVMNGSIDEVRVYDKLLGAAEIKKRYSMVQGTDLNRIADGNYFLDLNVWDQTDANATDSSNTSFAVDNNAPSTTDNAPSATQSSAFTVTLSCDDTSYISGIQASGCSYSEYRIDSGSWKQSSAIAVNDDGNHKIEYYSVDAAGNAGTIRTTYASLLLTGHSFNFGLRFDGNWWDGSVHIPGFVVDQNMQNTVSQTLTQGSTFDYASFSRNGLAIGLVSTGATYLMDITNVYSSTFNIYLQQAHRAGVDKEFYLAYTSGNYTAFEDKKAYVRNGEFLKRVNPAFGIATTAIYTITLGLDYFDSNVDINGSFHLGPGSHSLLITNQGTSNGKVVIGIEKN
ncbi:MAG: LamG domain-containing protein [Candidatus Diapherotrites archaeon]